MPIPDYQKLMKPVLESFRKKKFFKEVVNDISEQLKLSDAEKNEVIPSGNQTIIYNRIGWAKFYLVKAGLLDSPKRGEFIVTERGIQALNQNVEINNDYLKQFESFNNFISNKDENKTNDNNQRKIDNSTPDELIETAYSEINDQLKSQLLEKLKNTNPIFFEKIVIELMLAMGYGIDKKAQNHMTKKSHDNGIDGIINEDVLGLDKIYLQAKRYDKHVGREAIQAFIGALVGEGATKGVFITTGYFSKPALEYAKNQKIILIDGNQLCDLLIKYNVGILPDRKIELKKIDLTFFDEDI